MQLLRSRMQHFVSVLEQYTLIEVIQSSWSVFKQSMGQQHAFEDLIKLHNDFLDAVKAQSVDVLQIQKLASIVLDVRHLHLIAIVQPCREGARHKHDHGRRLRAVRPSRTGLQHLRRRLL